MGGAEARQIIIGGIPQAAAVDSKLYWGNEYLAIWTLPRLGISVRNDADDVRLLLHGRELRWSPTKRWQALGFKLSPQALKRLAAPEKISKSLYVPLESINLLGVKAINSNLKQISFAMPIRTPTATLPPSQPATPPTRPPVRPAPSQPKAPPPIPGAPDPIPTHLPPNPNPPPATPPVTPSKPPPAPLPLPSRPSPAPLPSQPSPPTPLPGGTPTPIEPPTSSPTPVPEPTQPSISQSPSNPVANLDVIRVSRSLNRTVETQRVVMELSQKAVYRASKQADGVSVMLENVNGSSSSQRLPSGDTLTVQVSPQGTKIDVLTGGGNTKVFTLDNPFRVVIDTITHIDKKVPPPINPEALPAGVTYRNTGKLHLLSFDPRKYQAKVVTAPAGRSAKVGNLVRSVGGIAGMNGGYFNPKSSLPVDLVVTNGLMTSSSLERRGTVGMTSNGNLMFGYPKPRYIASGSFGKITINSVRADPRPNWLTAFVGDGVTTTGDPNLVTLHLNSNQTAVAKALMGKHIPAKGVLTLSYDPQKFPTMPRFTGAPIRVSLSWRGENRAWPSAKDALSAGPLLLKNGRVVINPNREKFNTLASVWRPTRQVAFGILRGQPTLAYYLQGTPENFASALAKAGFTDAIRMDSGSSSTVYVAKGGFGSLNGYLNTVWGKQVPNAIVMVPK